MFKLFVMKQTYLFFAIIFLSAFSPQKGMRKKFNIEIYYESNNYAGIKIYLNQDRINIAECSGTKWGCKNAKISYKKELSKNQSDTIYWTLRELNLDTLKSVYNFQNTTEVSVYDGRYGHYTFSGDGMKLIKTTTYAMSTPAIDSLENLINRMIVPEKYWKINSMFY